MSVDFELVRSRVNPERFVELVLHWIETEGIEVFRNPMAESTPHSAEILGAGSIRGFHVDYQPDERVVCLTLNAFASQRDWDWAYRFLRLALRHWGGAVEREGSHVPFASLSPSEAQKEARRNFWISLDSARLLLRHHSEKAVILPVANIYLIVGINDCADPSPEGCLQLEQRLVDRLDQLARRFVARVMLIANRMRMSVWPGMTTIMNPVHAVHVDYEPDDAPPPSSISLVPIEDLLQIMGTRVEYLGNGQFLLPVLDLDKPLDAVILERLLGKARPIPELLARHSTQNDGLELKTRVQKLLSAIDLPKEGKATIALN